MEKVNYSLSDVSRNYLPLAAVYTGIRSTYFAEHGSYDAGPVAVQKALLIDRVMTNQIFHHQQESSDAVSL